MTKLGQFIQENRSIGIPELYGSHCSCCGTKFPEGFRPCYFDADERKHFCDTSCAHRWFRKQLKDVQIENEVIKVDGDIEEATSTIPAGRD